MRDIILYSDVKNHETYLELWGASTKHPDSLFRFSNFKKVEFIDEHFQIFQWLLECASKLNFPFHAENLCLFAVNMQENLYLWAKTEES